VLLAQLGVVAAQRLPRALLRIPALGLAVLPAARLLGGPAQLALAFGIDPHAGQCPTPDRPGASAGGAGSGRPMKKILELIVCFFHPVAVVLGWIDLARRSDLTPGSTIAWAIFLIIPVVPFLYVLTGGRLWGRR
jgi:hypothetical protein